MAIDAGHICDIMPIMIVQMSRHGDAILMPPAAIVSAATADANGA